ncbi:RHS repeat protein [Halomonas sp. FME20]|uniref:RHS repeat protein n=1 Tax=Halomonas colorata TaxID=2742615 RepID=A0ABR9G3D9_9GAMM|nr:RHS repeat protein [Halomonas colorata]
MEADGSHQYTTYDDIGRLNELTLGNGAVYRFAYDDMDRLRPGRPAACHAL